MSLKHLINAVLAVALVSFASSQALAQGTAKKAKAPAKKAEKVEEGEIVSDPTFTSQEAKNKHAVTLEILGRAGLYSFNYDYLVHPNVAIGAGLSYYSINSSGTLLFPLYGNFYFMRGNNRVYATAGGTIVTGSFTDTGGRFEKSGIAGTIGAGFEHRSDSGFLFRAGPYFLFGQGDGIWLGLSFGITF